MAIHKQEDIQCQLLKVHGTFAIHYVVVASTIWNLLQQVQ